MKNFKNKIENKSFGIRKMIYILKLFKDKLDIVKIRKDKFLDALETFIFNN
jgi:hypothetical protein